MEPLGDFLSAAGECSTLTVMMIWISHFKGLLQLSHSWRKGTNKDQGR